MLASSYSAPDKGGTGRWEPAVLAGRFGKGRSLTILLGHDAEAMDNPGFQALLLRAVEWAATGRVSAGQARERSGPWRWEEAGRREPGARRVRRTAVEVPLRRRPRRPVLPSPRNDQWPGPDLGPAARSPLAPRPVVQLEIHQQGQLLGARREDRPPRGQDLLVERQDLDRKGPQGEDRHGPRLPARRRRCSGPHRKEDDRGRPSGRGRSLRYRLDVRLQGGRRSHPRPDAASRGAGGPSLGRVLRAVAPPGRGPDRPACR